MKRKILTLGAFVMLAAFSQTQPISFMTAPSYPTPTSSKWIDLADMDGDGDLDVISAESQDQVSTVSVIKNRGDGTYEAPVSYPCGPSAMNVTAGDFNGDGRPDVVVSNYLSGTHVNDLKSYVTVYMNDGSGGLTGRLDLPVGQNSHPTQSVVADFDKDGKLDFAVATANASTVYVYRSLGNGNFALWSSPRFDSVEYLAVADVNADSRPDLIGGNVDATQILRNTGTGFALGQYTDNFPDGVAGIATGDFDGDGDTDYATSGRFLTVYQNTGGIFTKVGSYLTGENLSGIEASDVDGDLDIDLVGAVYLGNSFSVYHNDGSGNFNERRDWGVGDNPWNVALGDVNGDGKLDVLSPNSWSVVNGFTVALNASSKEFVARREYPLIGDAAGVDLADFNNDGLMDFVTGVYVSNQDRVAIFFGQADGSQRDAFYLENIGNNIPTDVVASDFDNDGNVDVAASIFSPGNSVRVWFNRGSEQFSESIVLEAGGNPGGVGAGDLNRDGFKDIVNANSSSLDNSIHVHYNRGDGSFQPGIRIPTFVRPSDATFGDFDKDGDEDFVVTHGGSNNILLFRTEGQTLTQETINVGSAQGNAVVADLNGDGWVDIALACGGSVKVLRNNGSGGFFAPVTSPVIAGRIAAADFDRDGDLDITGTNGTVNLAYVGVNDGSGKFSTVLEMTTGFSPDRNAAGDLNGDGLPDILVANGRGGTVSVFKNRTASGGPVDVAPSGFTIFRGSLVSGGLAELISSDDKYLVVRNGPIAFPTEAPITVYFDGTYTGSTHTALSFTIENKVSINGLTQIVDLFNYTTNSYDTTAVDTRPGPTTDTVVTINGTGTIGRFFGTGGALRARLRVRPAGPLFTNNWRTSVDQVKWTVTP